MAIIPLQLPPGMYKNGTPYAKKGRIEDGNLVRYHDGSWRPIGGWSRRRQALGGPEVPALIADPTIEAVRDIIAWRGVSGQEQNSVFFSNLAAYHLSAAGTVTDITPGAYSPINSSKDAASTRGYGLGLYGIGPYGVAVSLTGEDVVPPDRWYSDVFGEVLLFGSINNGSIYELDLGTLTTSVVANAPTNNADMCVTEERQVFVVAADGEPRRVRASEVENRTVWAPATNNQAIDRVLPGNGRLLRCIPVLNEILILGEQDANVARYIRPPFVYSIEEVGVNCGPIAAQAVAKTASFAAWWGTRSFWVYDGSVKELPCEVIDFLYDDINPGQVSKISATSNVEFSELWWFYQSATSTTGEVDSYVAWNYVTQTWTTGRLNRTAGIDKGVLTSMVMVDADGQIFNHELDRVFPLNEGDVFLESGPIDLMDGEQNVAVRYLYPDQETLGSVNYTFFGRQFPTAIEHQYGPYTAANPTPTRAIGRSLRLRADMTDVMAEVGILRMDVAPTGTGRR